MVAEPIAVPSFYCPLRMVASIASYIDFCSH